MKVSKELLQLIKTKISDLSYLKKNYKISITNIDKNLFLCEIKMVNDSKSGTIKYIQVWDNLLEEFIFTKEQFFSTGIPAHKDLKFDYKNNIYFFLVQGEYIIYSTINREFIDLNKQLKADIVVSIKSYDFKKDALGKDTKFIILLDGNGSRKLLIDDEVNIIKAISINDSFLHIIGRAILIYKKRSNNCYFIDRYGEFLFVAGDDIPKLIEGDGYTVLQFEINFIFVKNNSDIKKSTRTYLGEFKELLYDEFIVLFDHKIKDIRIFGKSRNIRLFNNEEDNNLNICTVPLDYDVSVKIPNTSDSFIVQHSALPYRIFYLMDGKIIRKIMKLDL